MLSRFVVIALCVGMSWAATWMGYTPMKPQEFANKTGCYVKEINDVIPFGETITPLGYCYRVSCGERMMDYASCGIVMTDDPKCHIIQEDLSKPYPRCCPDVKCDVDNDIDDEAVKNR